MHSSRFLAELEPGDGTWAGAVSAATGPTRFFEFSHRFRKATEGSGSVASLNLREKLPGWIGNRVRGVWLKWKGVADSPVRSFPVG